MAVARTLVRTARAGSVRVEAAFGADGEARLTLQTGPGGGERAVFSATLAADVAEAILRACPAPIAECLRHTVPAAGRTWWVDEPIPAAPPACRAILKLGRGQPLPAETPDWVGAPIDGPDDPSFHGPER
ncbi:MAG: hypothetical protein KDC18_08315 [Alphaproteobacteria bacterium]|nr:hypothetical protein [Alphaproteobacteria bacterium]MCB9929370.1 hypothetical protein [Alphaproteobacteria bacterium]